MKARALWRDGCSVVRARRHLRRAEHIGSRVRLNGRPRVIARGRLIVPGPRCLIEPHCMVMDTAFHDVDPERRLEAPRTEPIDLAENVWLGARVIVMPGVSIGADCAIRAGSVVTRDILPRAFAAGVPARVIRDL